MLHSKELLRVRIWWELRLLAWTRGSGPERTDSSISSYLLHKSLEVRSSAPSSFAWSSQIWITIVLGDDEFPARSVDIRQTKLRQPGATRSGMHLVTWVSFSSYQMRWVNQAVSRVKLRISAGRFLSFSSARKQVNHLKIYQKFGFIARVCFAAPLEELTTVWNASVCQPNHMDNVG